MPKAVLWDIGNVVVRWNPRTLYSQIFEDPAECDRFLSDVCNMVWHVRHDFGVTFAENRLPLLEAFPHYSDQIHAWETRWWDMFSGVIAETEDVIHALAERGVHPSIRRRLETHGWKHQLVLGEFIKFYKGPDWDKPGPQDLVSVVQFEQHLAPVWPRLQAELPAYDSATIVFGSLGSDAIKVEYLAENSPHIRAKNTLTFSPSGELLSHKRFAEKPWGEQITSAWKMLHTGQYWGWSGQLMMMLSSLSLLGFAWLGISLFRSRTTPR